MTTCTSCGRDDLTTSNVRTYYSDDVVLRSHWDTDEVGGALCEGSLLVLSSEPREIVEEDGSEPLYPGDPDADDPLIVDPTAEDFSG